MEEVALSRERMYQAILEDVSVFMNISLKIEMQKAIARGQGETVMRLYKAA
jgi:small nuclear ribonucleoprotein (snRNP)-like protein